MKRIPLFFLLALFTTACSTQQVSTPASANLWQVNDTIAVKVTGQVQDNELLARLTREIKSQLILAGFDIEKQSDKKLLLNVHVRQYTPGNNALRLTVGFGAGRGSLIYTAEYIGTDGKVLAKMDGQERFTGQEVGFNTNYGVATTLGGEETVRTVLLKEAGRHIVELAVKPEAAR